MSKPAIHLPSNKLLIGAGGAVLALFLLWYGILALSFSADSIRQKTLGALSQHLGAEVTAIDLQQFSLMPFPKLTLNSVRIKNHPKARYPSLLSTTTVEVQPSLASIFGDLVVTVTFYDPKLEFETFADKTNSWDLPDEAEKSDQEIALLQQLNFVDSTLHYADPKSRRDITLKNLTFGLQFSSAQDYAAEGHFQLARDIFYFSAAVDSSGGREISLSNSSSTYHLTGNWEADTGKFSGEHRLESQDLGQLLEVFLVSGKGTPKLATGEEAYPFTFSSSLKMKGKRLTLSEVALGGEEIEGEGQVVGLIGSYPEINAQLDLKKLSLNKLLDRGVFKEFIANTAHASNIDGYRIELPEDKASSLPGGVKMTVALKSEKAKFSDLEIDGLQLAAKLDNSLIDVAQLSGKLAGDGQFILKGKVEGSYDGLAFKGSADVAGQEFATVFQPLLQSPDATVFTLPDSFKRFRGRANLFVNPAVMRLSEGVVRVENMQFLGTMVRQYLRKQKAGVGITPTASEERTGYRYEGAFRLSDVNFDEILAPQLSADEGEEKNFLNNRDQLFSWMKGVMQAAGHSQFNFKLNLVDATFQEKKRDTANLRFILNRQLFGLEELELPYNGSFIQGGMRFQFPANAKPKVEADLRLDSFDSEEFFGKSFDKKASMWRDENGHWSRKEFNILWLGDVDLQMALRAGQITHAEYDLKDASGNLKIENGVVQLRDIVAGIWGGKLSGNGKMIIGKLPTFSGNVSLNGFDFSKLHGVTDLFSTLYGGGSFRGQFSTTGVNPHSAIHNMKGSLSFAGSGLKVSGFNLANMVRAANAVRTVEDIEKLVTYANRGGETKITTVQGNMNIDGGFLRTPMMQIATPVGNGSIKGQINLMDWKTNVAISIFLTALKRQNPPDIRLVFVGPLNEVGRSLDTQSLESFIAKTAAERLLVNP